MNPILIKLAKELRRHPWLAEHTRVFGSAVTRPDEAHDLDIGLVISSAEANLPKCQSVMSALLGSARARYGYFDPFLLVEGDDRSQDQLWVRNATATGWTIAKKSRALASQIRAGEAFGSWFERVITPGAQADTQNPVQPGSKSTARRARPG